MLAAAVVLVAFTLLFVGFWTNRQVFLTAKKSQLSYFRYLTGIKFFTRFNKSIAFLGIIALSLGLQTAFGQSIFTNPITGTNPNTANPYTAGQTVSAGITVSGIGRGSGITGQNQNDEYRASGWNSVSLDSNKYFEWTITPNSCRGINLESFVYQSNRSHNSISNFAFRSSIDGFSANIGTPTFGGTTINLSALEFQNITTPITFRLYAWGANNTSRTFSIVNFTFNGTITTNPTANAGPATTAICQGGTSAPLGGSVGGGATGGTWSSSAGGTFTPNATTLNATWTPPAAYTGTATLTLTTSGGSCGTTTASKTIVVNPRPTPSFTTSPSANVCVGTSVTYTTQGSNFNYIWNVPGVSGTDYTITSGGIGTGSNTVTLTWLTPGLKNVTVNYNNSNGCNGAVAASNSITVNPRPTPTFTASPSGSGCIGSSVTYTTQSGNTNYGWSVPGTAGTDYTITAGGIGTGSNSVTLTWLTSGLKTVTVNYTNSNGCASITPASNTFTVTPNKSASASTNPSVCAVSGDPNIVHSTLGVTGIGAATGLPTGVTATFSGGNITISGSPTQVGTFNYSIPLIGSCGPDAFATGTITVTNCACEDLFTVPGGGTFTVPNGVIQIIVETWGAGGRGGTRTTNGTGGGGGGGGYSRSIFSVSGGQAYSYSVGAGGTGATPNGGNTTFGSGFSLVVANGGTGVGNTNAGGVGGTLGTGDVRYTGGTGGTGSGSAGGGGGSSASSASNGTNGAAPAGGTLTGGGSGGAGTTIVDTNGEAGQFPGGGGGGSYRSSSNQNGGSGGNGQIKITYTLTAGVVSGQQAICLGGTTTLSSSLSGGTWSSSNTAVATVDPSTGVVTGVTIGNASIRYTIVGSCAVATASRTVFVTQPINPGTISGTQEICIGSTTNFIPTSTNGTWSSSNTAVATVSSTGLVTGFTAGTATISYTLPASGGCPPVSTTRTVTVTAPPIAGTLSGTQQVCVAGTTTFTSTSLGGTWTIDNPAIATVNPTTGVITGVAPGTATLTYTVAGAGGCPDASATRTVTVTAPPDAGIVSGSIELCVGENTTYASTMTGGTWSSSNISVATVNSSTGEVIAVNTGTAVITYTVPGTGGCANATATGNLTVYALPTPTYTLQPTSAVCVGTSVTYTTQTGQLDYDWDVEGDEGTDYTITSGGIGSTSNSVTLSWLTGGTKEVSVNYSNANGCIAPASITNSLVVNPLPVPTFTAAPSAAVCVGASVTYTTESGQTNYIWTVTGTPGTDYTITAGGIGTSSYTVTLTWLTSGTKVVTVNYTNANGCTASAAVSNSLVVNPMPVPTFTAAPTAAVCVGTSVTYTTESSQTNYIWTVPGTSGTDYNITAGGIGTSSNTVTLTWLTSGTKVVTVNYSNANGCTAIAAVSNSLVVNPLPVPTFTAVPTAAVCVGASVTYTTESSQTNYIWTVPGTSGTDYNITAGGIGTTSNTITLTWLTSGTKVVTVNYSNANGCTATAAVSNSLVVNPLPVPTFTAAPTSAACVGTSVTYTAESSQTNYIWTVPGTSGTDYNITAGGIGTSSNTVTLTWLTSGTKVVTVNYSNANGCTAIAAVSNSLVVNPLPVPTFTAAPTAAVCVGASVTYTTESGQTNYIWTVPGTSGTDYNITAGGIGTTSNTITLTWLTSGTKVVTVNYSNPNGCTATAAVSNSLVVNPLPVPTFTLQPSNPVCIGDEETYTTQGGQSNYSWTISGTATVDYNITGGGIGTNSSSVTIEWLTPGSKTVTVNFQNANGCPGLASATNTIEVSLITAITTQPDTMNQVECFGDGFDPISITATGSNLSYQWFRKPDNSDISTNPGTLVSGATSATFTPPSTQEGTSYYYVIITGNCGSQTSDLSGALIVNPSGTLITDHPNVFDETICLGGGTFTALEVAALGDGGSTVTYQWYQTTTPTNTSGTLLSGQVNSTFTPPSDAPFADGLPRYYFATASSSCGTVPSNISGAFSVNPITAINVQNLAGATICQDNGPFGPISVTASGTGTLSYQWYTTTTGVINTGVDTQVGSNSNSFTPPSNTPDGIARYYYVVVSSTNGCGPSVTSALSGGFIVNPNNTASAPSATPTVCINTAIPSITHTTSSATGIGIATGLPTGVSAIWAANTITISGTPSVSGTFNYSIPLTGGCGTMAAIGTITVTPDMNVTSTQANGTTCINQGLTAITHTTALATGIGTATGLPTGVTANWAANTITISGTPSVSGIFNYSIPLTGGCGTVTATGTITVTPDMTVTSSQASGTTCVNQGLTAITHTTTLATGIGPAIGLPIGVTANWAANTITISGTPSVSGTFNYSIPLTGGCGTLAATGTISVTPDMTTTSAQPNGTTCINQSLTDIQHTTTLATGIGTASGLPTGVTANWAANTITISGTPTVSGTFNYSIPLTGGCGTVTASGTITVTPNMTVTSAQPNGTSCINVGLTNITQTTTLATGIGAPTGLPAGVTANWAANTITISGTPSVSGTFNYSIPLTGGCGTVAATGTIMVTPNMTVSSTQANGTTCISTALTNIQHTTTLSTGIGTATGLPTGVTASWSANTITISGTPSVSGTFNYSIPLTGGCGTVAATGTITVTPNMTMASAQPNGTTCINAALTNIQHTTTLATGIGAATGLPTGVTASWSANTITISGTPSLSGTFNYSIPLIGGCGTVAATGTITVNPLPQINNIVATPICSGQAFSVIPVNGTNGIVQLGTTYTWTVSPNPNVTGEADQSTQQSSISQTLTNTTNANQIVTYTVTPRSSTGCIGNTFQVQVTVFPTPTVNLVPNQTAVCSGTSSTAVNFTGNGVAGVVYNWTNTNPAIGIAASGSGNIPSFTTQNTTSGPITSTITVTPTANGCAGPSTSFTITVNPSPIVTILADYCSVAGSVELFASSSVPGTTWVWSNGATTSSILVNTAGLFSATGTVNGCSTTASLSVAEELVVDGSFTNFNPASPSFNTEYTQNQNFYVNGNPATGLWPERYYAVNVNANGSTTTVPPGYHTNFHGRDHTNNSTGNRNFMMVNGGALIGSPLRQPIIWEQTVTVEPNTDYYFSAWAMNLNPGSPAKLQFEINGELVGTILDLNTAPKPTSAAGVSLDNWRQFFSNPSWSSGSATTAVIRIVNLNTNLGGNDFGLDDISFGTLSPFIRLTSAAGTDVSQVVCENSPIIDIEYRVGGGLSGPVVENLPPGITSVWNGVNLRFSGSPTQAGTYNYTIFTTGACLQVRAEGTIVVRDTPTEGAITSNQTVCTGQDPSIITGNTYAPQEAGAMISYRWELNTNLVTPSWSNVPGNPSGASYDPPVLSQTTQYRRYTISTVGGLSCESPPTAPVTITVQTVPTAGAIAAAQTICNGGDPEAFTSTTAGTGDGTITYQWESAVSPFSSWSAISGANSATYDAPAGLTTTTRYRRITISTLNSVACLSPATAPVEVTVQSVPNAGAIAAAQSICSGGDPAAFTSTTAGSGDGLITYRWESAVSPFSSWTTISGATSETYDVPAGLTVTTQYRRVAISTLNSAACEAITTPVQVTILPNNTVTPVNPDPAFCLATASPIIITHTTTGATGIVPQSATVDWNLPNGVTPSWNAGVLTIQGTPTEFGVFNYSIPLSGGCGALSATGTITVENPNYPITSISVVNPTSLPGSSTFTVFSPNMTPGTYEIVYSTNGVNGGANNVMTTVVVSTSGQFTWTSPTYSNEGSTVLTINSIRRIIPNPADPCAYFPPNNNTAIYGFGCSSESLQTGGNDVFYVPANVFQVTLTAYGDGSPSNTRTMPVIPGGVINIGVVGNTIFATESPVATATPSDYIVSAIGPNGRIVFTYDCTPPPPCSGSNNVSQYTDSEGYTVIRVTGDCSSWTWAAPDGLDEFEVLVVGGGGGGGYGEAAGGGGGGAVIYQQYTGITMNGLPGLQGASFTITPGGQGLGATSTSQTGGPGEASTFTGTAFNFVGNGTFSALNAAGGGGGGTSNSSASIRQGGSGASGGGGAAFGTSESNGGSGTDGNSGGSAVGESFGAAGAGGGGAAGPGGGGAYSGGSTVMTAGSGGNGQSRTISGELIFYGAGGGGTSSGAITNVAGSGGSPYNSTFNAGGNGNNNGVGQSPTTYGSGGGAGRTGGSNGFQGVVYIRYPNFRILPIEYLYFNAKHDPQSRSGQLSWATSREWENSHFEIERAVNEVKTWTKVGEVTGSGYSDAPVDYSFTDSTLPAAGGNIFYRLKQVNLSGNSEYSVTRSIQVNPIASTTNWIVYPNPTSGDPINLELVNRGTYNDEKVSVRIISATGQFDTIEGNSSSLLSAQLSDRLKNKLAGVYTLEISWGSNREYHKVILKR